MRIFVAGHRGMVGSAILRQLAARGQDTCITAGSDMLDLTDQAAVRDFLHTERPDAIVLAAARVGGILANQTFPAQFIYDNLMIAANVIHQAHCAGVTRLLQLGSSCIYPRDAAQPITEDALLTGPLEPTNAPYAIAKIAAIKLCESYNQQYGTDYRSIMPTNLYGPGDNFHPQNAHVLPAMMQRFHLAAQNGDPTVTVWGSGTPRREFLHVDDLATAALFVLEMDRADHDAICEPAQSHVNVGTGQDVDIRSLAIMMAKVTGFRGEIRFDPSKPDGTPRKVLDVSRLGRLGWSAQVELLDGINHTYDWYRTQLSRGAGLRAG